MRKNKTAKITAPKNTAALTLTAKPTATEDFDGVGQCEILSLMRQIKHLSQDEAEVAIEVGDQLWRLADRAAQIIEARNVRA